MRFELDESTPYVPHGTMPQTVEIDRDGTVVLVNHDIEYDIAFAAMGGAETPYMILHRAIEENLHQFFIDRYMVSSRVSTTICERAVDRLLSGIEEFDRAVVHPYRMRLEGSWDGAIFVSDLLNEMRDRALETFRERPDLTVDEYDLFVRRIEVLMDKVHDVFTVGPDPSGSLTATTILQICREAAYHIHGLKEVFGRETAVSEGSEAIRAENLRQFVDFLDATEAERAK